MEKILFFANARFYPYGGAGDFFGEYESIKDLAKLFELDDLKGFKNQTPSYSFIDDKYKTEFSILYYPSKEVVEFDCNTIPEEIKKHIK